MTAAGEQAADALRFDELNIQDSFKICTQNVGGRSASAGTLIPELRKPEEKKAFARQARWPQNVSPPNSKGKATKPLIFSDRIIEGFRSCSMVLLQEVGASGFLDKFQRKLNGLENSPWEPLRPRYGASFQEVVAFYDSSSLVEAPVEINLAALVRVLVDSAVRQRRRNGHTVLGLHSTWWYDTSSIGVRGREHPIVLAFKQRTMTLKTKVDGMDVYIVNAHHFSKKNPSSGVFPGNAGNVTELLGVMCRVLRALADENGVLRALTENGALPENGALRTLADENGMRSVLIGDLNVKVENLEIVDIDGNSVFGFDDQTQLQADALKRAVPRGSDGLDWAVSFGQVRAIANTSTDRDSTQMQGLGKILDQAKASARRIRRAAAPGTLTRTRRKELKKTRELDEEIFVPHNSSDHPPAIFEIHAHIDV